MIDLEGPISRTTARRRTIVVQAGLAYDHARVEAARSRAHGAQVTTVDRLAARMAGGFLAGIDPDVLLRALSESLASLPVDAIGDLAAIADLPGLPAALRDMYLKTWRAGIDLEGLAARSGADSRLLALARIEADVLCRLPRAMRRPADLVALGLTRLRHARAVFGDVQCRLLGDVDPCWRPLVAALADVTTVTWKAGVRDVPAWVRTTGLRVERTPAATPDVVVASCASARHEVVEVMRWTRSLLASGVPAHEVAIAAAAPGAYDDLVQALSAEANLDVHFEHGRRALTTRAGQAAAALADVLLRGIDHERMRRLARLVEPGMGSFGQSPSEWEQHVPRAAPLDTAERWRRALVAGGAPDEVASPLLAAVTLLERGLGAAEEAGEAFLRGAARDLWRRALGRAPAQALEASLGELRLPDQVEPATSVAWTDARALASCPRPHAWLLGLNSRAWPRRDREDPLLPDRLVPACELRARTLADEDRGAFSDVLAASIREVICSYARRDAEGRLLGRSALLPSEGHRYLHAARTPECAMSEPDRMMARPDEFAASARAASTDACWRDWRDPGLTAHDGLVRPGHPTIAAALAQVQSASSLRLLLRNPQVFVWRYGLGWRSPEPLDAAFDLDNSTFGTLVHEILHEALVALEAGAGLRTASPDDVIEAVRGARVAVNDAWELAKALPPPVLWAKRLDEAAAMAVKALSLDLAILSGQRSHSEVVFPAVGTVGTPWLPVAEVVIPGTALRIGGRIDRLDLSADGRWARVLDYKTGRMGGPVVLGGGQELQRCLYAFAVGALLGPDVRVESALLYPHGGDAGYRPLEDNSGTLAALTSALVAARRNLERGGAVPGPDAGDAYDDLRFALTGAAGSLLERKKCAAAAYVGDAAEIWEAP